MNPTRLFHSFRLSTIRSSAKRVEYLKKHDLLASVGEKCYWGPKLLPLYSELIKLHNNVVIHKKAKLIPHDMINVFLKRAVPGEKFGSNERIGCIELMDNVYVAMNAIILPNVRIGNNCIITAGSVVSSDIPDNSVVAGNPAKVVGRFDLYVASRLMNKERNIPFKNQILSPERVAAEWEYFEKSRHEAVEQNNTSSAGNFASADDAAFKSVRDKVVKVLSDNISGVDFETAQNLVINNVFDSLSLITVVNLLEEAFSCKIPFQKVNADNFNSVDSMAAMILGLGGESLMKLRCQLFLKKMF